MTAFRGSSIVSRQWLGTLAKHTTSPLTDSHLLLHTIPLDNHTSTNTVFTGTRCTKASHSFSKNIYEQTSCLSSKMCHDFLCTGLTTGNNTKTVHLLQRQDSKGIFRPKSSKNYLQGTVHWGVPGELNTFKDIFVLAFAPPIGNPYLS